MAASTWAGISVVSTDNFDGALAYIKWSTQPDVCTGVDGRLFRHNSVLNDPGF